jgi:hypothetical protein
MIERIFSPRTDYDPYPSFALDAVAREFVGYHVTDTPARLTRFLEGKEDLCLMGSAMDDLGAGLYVSAMPQIWASRSTNKWAFLKELDEEGTRRLCQCLADEPALKNDRWVTASEKAEALKALERVATGKLGSDSLVMILANQPYNIPFSSPEWLQPRGFTPSPQPVVMEIRFKGTIAMLDQTPTAQELLEIGRAHSGVAVRNGFGSVAQAVLWKREDIVGWKPAEPTSRKPLPAIPRVPMPAEVGADASIPSTIDR